MKLLVDTHAFIWFVEDDKNLPSHIRKELENTDNALIFSIASLWEMTIKMSLGKLIVNFKIEEVIEKISDNGFEILPVLPEHIIKLSQLPFIHRDPFDRMLISQGLSENIKIVSKDEIFDDYKIKRFWNK